MKKNIILAVGIITVTVLSGCGTTSGPATTTLDPMKLVGPVTLIEKKTVIEGCSTNITILEHIESPESAQVRLRETELKSRRNSAGSSSRQYWWQTQTPYQYQGNYPVYSNGGYWGGTR